MRQLIAAGVAAAVALAAAVGVLRAANSKASPEPSAAASGDPRRGAALVTQYGCGTCHVIPGVPSASGNVGPPLTSMGDRVYIAGVLANTPENMIRWLQHPQAIVPGNAMPDLGLTEQDARDLTAYLDSLR